MRLVTLGQLRLDPPDIVLDLLLAANQFLNRKMEQLTASTELRKSRMLAQKCVMLLVIVQLLPYHTVIHVAVNHLAADIGTLLQEVQSLSLACNRT